ncbi:hypothetical protein ACFL52_01120 [Candidatus Margulisiibacteriota bacterium]
MQNPPEKTRLLIKINAPMKKIEQAVSQINAIKTGHLTEQQQRAINNIKTNYQEFVDRLTLYLTGKELA